MSVGVHSSIDWDAVPDRSVLTIDLGAVRANYRILKDMQAPRECAAVVKANGYGLGLEQIARALWAQGCRTFFVATQTEALELRQILDEAIVYCLDGLIGDNPSVFATAGLRPVLGSIEEIEAWAAYGVQAGRRLPCAIHIDTGMSRLGLEPAAVPKLAGRKDLLDQVDLALVMTHLVSAEVRDDPLTLHQADLFDKLRALLPAVPTSFGNSAGTQLCATQAGQRFAYDLARPGVALYGAHVFTDAPNPMHPVATLKARVLAVRDIDGGDTIGYNATWRASGPMRVATLATGYADGFLRSLSATNVNPGLPVYFGNAPAPLLGRVSMDYIGVDVSNINDPPVQRGDWAELIGPHVTVDDMAKRAGTNAYEILTSLGNRSRRVYVS